MTGRDLIIYILQNHLEDEPIFKDGSFIGCLTDLEFAAKMKTGVETIRALAEMGKLHSIKIENTIYILDFSVQVRGEHEENN